MVCWACSSIRTIRKTLSEASWRPSAVPRASFQKAWTISPSLNSSGAYTSGSTPGNHEFVPPVKDMKTALICGVSGQDGSYLSKLLLGKGYRVYGSSRDAQVASFNNLARLGIREQVEFESVSLTDFRSVLQALMKVQPDEVYNLAGQSSVGISFQQQVETLESNAQGTLNLLEAIRFSGSPIKLYNAGSSECFGDTADTPADETTQFRPRSPYAVAKAAAFWEVANYREA